MKGMAEEGGDTVVGNYATYDQVLITGVGLSPLKQLFKRYGPSIQTENILF